jgi:UDPglucose--hexose-1-phosphate uridylyltransferase
MAKDHFFKTTLTKPDGRALHLYSRSPIDPDIQATNPAHENAPARPHMRWHPLRQEWVVYASHRQNRTFLPPEGYSPLAVTVTNDFPTEMPEGNYEIAVFENLYPSLNLTTDSAPDLYIPTAPARGVCEVIVFTKDPKTSLGALSVDQIQLTLEVLAERTTQLKQTGKILYVLPFENRGVEQGVTLHHPHGQIYAYAHIPPVPRQLLHAMKEHWDQNHTGLIAQIITDEMKDGRRIIAHEEKSIAFVPAFARYPYETWIAPLRPATFLSELTTCELHSLAKTLKITLMKFDRLWSKPFPYLMTIFQGPLDDETHPEAHVHIQIYPPLRTRDRLKYLAGTELGGGVFVNDSLPEEKAAELAAIVISE